MRFKRYLLPTAVLAALTLALVVAPDVLAQKNFGLDAAAGSSIPKTTDLAAIIGRILKALLGFVGTLFLVLMVYAGFLYMTARGDTKKVDSAKQMIVGAVIGVIIIASAYAITSFVLTAATGTGKDTTGTGTETAPAPKSKVGGPCQGGQDCEDPLICDTGTKKCI